MKYLKHAILLFAVLFLFLTAYQPKNAPAVACPSCPGNMRSSDDGMSCIPLCNKGDAGGCPDVSIGCPTLAEVPASCATCPLGWHPAGSDKCISEDMVTAISCPAPPASTVTTTTLANPASVNCVQNKGGTLEIKKDPEGNEYGVCHLPDGTSCEEWALFRGEPCTAV